MYRHEKLKRNGRRGRGGRQKGERNERGRIATIVYFRRITRMRIEDKKKKGACEDKRLKRKEKIEKKTKKGRKRKRVRERGTRSRR